MKTLILNRLIRIGSGPGTRPTMRTNENPANYGGRLLCRALGIGLSVALVAMLAVPGAAWAQQYHGGGARFSRAAGEGLRSGGFAGFQQRQNRFGSTRQTGTRTQGTQAGTNTGQRAMQRNMSPNSRPGMRQPMNPGMRPYTGAGARTIGPRPGQEHLPEWWQSHRGMNSQQQADALRRQPGFQNLPQRQQQRLLNRLQNFNTRSPQQQQRMMDRNEMFERLTPERQQEVRGAAQAFNRMDPARRQVMRQAFQQLRGMPPAEREQMLHSAYGTQFSPQERTVLGNLLSVEPYQPRVVTPYFGRP